MKRLGALTALAGLLVFAAAAQAQESKWVRQDCSIICSPVVLMQNMMQVTNLVNPVKVGELESPEGVVTFPGNTNDIDSRTFFTARVTAAFPTKFKPLILFFDLQWSPFLGNAVLRTDGSFDTDAASGNANAPSFVYGTIWRLIGGGDGDGLINGLRNPYYTLDAVPLIVYGGAGSFDAESAYNHIFTPELDQYLHIGKIIDPNGKAPFINHTSIHFFIDYLLTPFDKEFAGISPWVFSLGLTTPLAPLP